MCIRDSLPPSCVGCALPSLCWGRPAPSWLFTLPPFGGERPRMAWTMAAAHRAWSAPVVQSAAGLSAVGGVLLQDSPRGFVRQQ
eukprot:2582248-Alexandrium_andersonii.AAC.1